jgi:beta-galactosidase
MDNYYMKSCLNSVILTLAILLLAVPGLDAQGREEIPFNDEWNFQGQSVSGLSIDQSISLPHSWNTLDAQKGIQYYRGTGKYVKRFDAAKSWSGRRVFIRFEGVNITAKLVMNGHDIGEHKGGYAAFSFELTDHLLYDQINSLEITVSNEVNLEVIPLVGDFNNYGGIYRPVHLIVTDPVCITTLDYASPGIYLKQGNVSGESADLEVLTKMSNSTGSEADIYYRTSVVDASGEMIESQQSKELLSSENSELAHKYTIQDPHLWHGKKDPYLYQVKVDIISNGVLIDSKTEPLGLRFFHVDPNEGFFLNGEPIDLRGVSRHQDRQDKASAISDDDHREDMDLMLEMGINAIRLAHYQHAELIYDMADEAGLVVWAELPWVGAPGGFMSASNGYEPTEAFHSNARQQLLELIRQNYNHPSILMWSIFNEIQNPEGAEPIEFVKELNGLVKEEDPDRLSVGASMLNPQEHPELHGITDAIAWNRYFGWYYKEPKDMGVFLDELHQDFPDYSIGISEYGAGGSIHQHADELKPPNPFGSPHPEEWQSFYHEENLKIFDERPFVWGTYVWNMFDFGSHFRKEGDHFGINDKGLVTFDRKTKKDAFFFYKANWSDEPVLHITSSRFIFREEAETQVKVYSNLDNVSLTVNGESFPGKSHEKGIITWDEITLQDGNNGIIVSGTKDGETYYDDCTWVLEKPYSGMNLIIKVMDFMPIANRVAIGGVIVAFMIWLLGIRKIRRGPRWKKIILWIILILIALISILILLAKAYTASMGG